VEFASAFIDPYGDKGFGGGDRMIGSRLPGHRKFHYEPRFWDPEKEKREGRRIEFKRTHRKRQARQRSLVWLFILLGVAVYLMIFFSRLGW